jgi:hypothetical protein
MAACYAAGMKGLLLVFSISFLAACSSMQPVSVSHLAGKETNSEVQVGDRVEVVNRAGEKIDFTVTDITPQGISGEFGFVRYDEMRSLRVQRHGASNADLTWLWTALGIAAAAWLIASADSVSVCSPSPCPTD